MDQKSETQVETFDNVKKADGIERRKYEKVIGGN